MGVKPQSHRRCRRSHPSQPERFGTHETQPTAADAAGMVCRRHPQRRPREAQQRHHFGGECPAQASRVGTTNHSGLPTPCGEGLAIGHHGGQKLAVLAIDPSSQRSKGSILGDKTRMETLSVHPNAYIRPSASAGTLGGVARKTRETIILCEAAGYDTIFVETVGVGQSETAVHSMVDFFLLILISGAGDELQGIKRGIMEMADGIAVNKADGDNVMRANRAAAECRNALHLFPLPESGQETKVLTCSALSGFNIDEVWQMVADHVQAIRDNGYLYKKRAQQDVQMMYDTMDSALKNDFYQNQLVADLLPLVESDVRGQRMSAYIGAQKLLDAYFNMLKR